MRDDDVTELLDELRDTLAATDGLAEGDRDRLQSLVRRLEVEISDDEDDDDNIFDHLDDALNRFEAEHVDLVATINRIANVLSAGGI